MGKRGKGKRGVENICYLKSVTNKTFLMYFVNNGICFKSDGKERKGGERGRGGEARERKRWREREQKGDQKTSKRERRNPGMNLGQETIQCRYICQLNH